MEPTDCAICMDKPATVTTALCGHRVLCPGCARKCTSCPQCTGDIAHHVRVRCVPGIGWSIPEGAAKVLLPEAITVPSFIHRLCDTFGWSEKEVRLYANEHQLDRDRHMDDYRIDSGDFVTVSRQLEVQCILNVLPDGATSAKTALVSAAATIGDMKTQVARQFGIERRTAVAAKMRIVGGACSERARVDNDALVRTLWREDCLCFLFFHRRERPDARPFTYVTVKHMWSSNKPVDLSTAGVTPAWTVLELKVLLAEAKLADLDHAHLRIGGLGGESMFDDEKTLEEYGCTGEEELVVVVSMSMRGC